MGKSFNNIHIHLPISNTHTVSFIYSKKCFWFKCTKFIEIWTLNSINQWQEAYRNQTKDSVENQIRPTWQTYQYFRAKCPTNWGESNPSLSLLSYLSNNVGWPWSHCESTFAHHSKSTPFLSPIPYRQKTMLEAVLIELFESWEGEIKNSWT